MRRDKDCPYKKHCHDAPGCCPECDWHLAFEKFRNRIARLETRLSRTKAELDVYRGIEGCRYREMTDAELRGRCLTLPEHSSAALAAFRQLFKDFALTLCMEGPGQEVLDICLSISDFLEKAEKAAVVQEAEKKKGVTKR